MDEETRLRVQAALAERFAVLAEYEAWLYAANGKLYTAAISRYKGRCFVDHILFEEFDTEAEARTRVDDLEAWLIVQRWTTPEPIGV